MYDRRMLAAARLGRPTVSVGNMTTGGTGKTPVVRWLAERLREKGLRPAVLLRGYRVGESVESDEREMLAQALGEGVIVEAGASRRESAGRVLEGHPEVGTFLLDDGFQHRKVARDFDLVLVNAADPFGYGHVLPRGLLREPLTGLKRAHAVVLTRSDRVSAGRLAEIEGEVRRYNAGVPIYRAAHAHVGLRSEEGVQGLEMLDGRPFFAFAGIGNPESFGAQLRRDPPAAFVGHEWFPDHHDYSLRDLAHVGKRAKQTGAAVVVTTEKDWVKVARVAGGQEAVGLPVWRMELEVQFIGDDGERLLGQVLKVIGPRGG
jgi:tetraacyldisaccharide 4'-kinase